MIVLVPDRSKRLFGEVLLKELAGADYGQAQHSHSCMNARAAGRNGNVARQITRTSARIQRRFCAQSAELKDRQELRLHGKAKNEYKLQDGGLSA
jgi:hypothetical protein